MPLQASVPPRSHLQPFFGTLPEGGIITGGHLHHPGDFHDEEGGVHPRGWGYVLVAMCLISLSHVLDLARSWCITSFVNIVGSNGVSSLSILVVMNRIFSLWGFIIIGLNILDLRTPDVCLACGYAWWQWGILLSHLMYVLVINLRIPVTSR